VGNSLSFLQLLVFLTFGLFAVFEVIILKNRSRNPNPEKSLARSGYLFLPYVGITLAFTVFSLFYFIQGPRSLLWFACYTALIFPSLYFASSLRPSQKWGSLVIVLLLITIQAAAPIIQNGWYIYGPDEWRDFRVTTFITQTGGIANAPFFKGDFYSVVPLFDIENAIFSLFSGASGMWVISLMAVVSGVLFALIVYAIMMRLTKSTVLSLLTIILSVAAPGSSSQYLPSILGSLFGMVLVLLLVLLLEKGHRNLLIIGLLTVFTAAFVHPSGLIFFFLLSFGILILDRLFYNQQLSRKASSKIAGLFALSFVLSLACWSSQPVLFNGVFGPVITFVRTLLSVGQFQPSYQFQYNAPGLQIYALTWALPVAASAALLFFSLSRALRQRSGKTMFVTKENIPTILFFLSAAIVGLIVLFGGFFSVTNNPGAGIERYLTGSAYSLLGLSAAFLVFSILRFGKTYGLIMLAIIVVTLFIGISSPDSAPFENPSFGAVRTTYTSTIEANDWVRFINLTTNVYADHDTPLAYLVHWPNLQTQQYVGFEPIREILLTLKTNSFNPENITYSNSIFVIVSDEITNASLRSNFVDTIYDSGIHIGIIMPPGP
jgi:hypothetical protein